MMNEKKRERNKEVKSYIKNLIILIVSAVPLYFEISIAKNIFNIKNEKLIWLLDLGFYNAMVSIIFSLLIYAFSLKKTSIEVRLYYSEDKLDVVSLEKEDNKKILMELSIKGNRDYIPEKIILNYPDWLDFQIKGSKYTTAVDSLNQYHLNLGMMINQQKEVDLFKIIPIDVIEAGEEVEDSIAIIPEITKSELKKRIFIRTEVKGIKVKVREK